MFHEHDHVLDHVDDYVHEALDAPDAAHVERHTQTCRLCKVALEEARKRQAALETLPACEAAESLIRATLQGIDAHEHSWRRYRRYLLPTAFAAAAAVVLLLGGLHLYYLNLKPTPYDLTVIAQNELLAGTSSALRVQLVNRTTRQPLADVPVELGVRNPSSGEVVQLARFTTDAAGDGQPRFQLPDWAEGAYDLLVTARPRGTTEVLTQPIKLTRSWKLMLGSDKPVYQPGQTIRLRSLALRRPDLKPVTGNGVVFTVTDPKGNMIFKKQDVTSKYGIAAADCELASEILEGLYTVECRVGDTSSKLTVDVRKYVLPKFKIGIILNQPYYQPGQVVRGTVQADYFFGKPVVDGQVEIEVRATDVRPDVLHKVSARTDREGEATFDFRLPESLVGRPQDGGDARIGVLVTLTDTAGQKQSRLESRTVTASPLRIEVIPEGGTLARDLANMVYLFTSYADGRPARTRVVVSGIDRELTTNDLGVASFEVTPENEEVALTLRATDAAGTAVRKQVKLACGKPGQDFLVRTDRAVYNGGDTVRLTVLGGGVEPVFVDLVKDGQTLLSETVPLANGRGDHQLDLPPELAGTVELATYRYGGQGLPERKTRALYIRPARQLQVTATMDHKEYRPGGQAKMHLALTDSQGNATAGAISLAAVDEAVFAVLDQAPGMEKTFYLLEQQLLRPVYAIYPWSPDLSTSLPQEARNQFEQALFSRTWQTVAVDGSTPPAPSPRRQAPRTPPESVSRPRAPQMVVAQSFPLKEQSVKAAQETGLRRVEMGWKLLLGLAGAAVLLVVGIAVVSMLIQQPMWVGILCGILVLLITTSFQSSMLGTRTQVTFTKVANIEPAGAAPDRAMSFMAPREAAPSTMPTPVAAPAPKVESAPAAQAEPPRVREWFPETLLWRPEIITDDKGHASLDVDLADSITTWRLTGSAVSADGRLGALQSSIRVFQPFFVDLNLPVALTRGDEVAVPAVVYNYLDQPQTVELTLDDADWFERLDDASKKVQLAPGEVRSTAYRLRVRKVGHHQLQVSARGAGVADAIKKQIEVVPDGRRVETVHNGTLQAPFTTTLEVPPDAIEGSARAFVKIYPSSFSQLVEGLDNIFRMPSGCFEQTSSTTYPNVLALDYLRRTKKSVPEVEAKARQFIHLGYQRLVSFEVPGGGFDWFGRPPANRRLTAYGLLEFEDMARVHDVDPALIQRTREWLLAQRNSDGSWTESLGIHQESDPARGQSPEMARFATTAYIAWAVFGNHPEDSRKQATLDYLLSVPANRIEDPYVLALACTALAALDPEGSAARPHLERLETLKHVSEDGKRAWWQQLPRARTTFYGAGRSGNVETTALAVLAMVRAGVNPGTVRAALAWLTEQKDAHGTWHSTQATVLALKALLEGTGKPLGGDQARHIEVDLDGKKLAILIPADQAEVMQQLDLSQYLTPGRHRLTLTEQGDTAAGYQVAFRYHVPGGAAPEKQEPLRIELTYDRTELKVGDTVTATALVTNQVPTPAPMVILDLPVPGGFTAEIDDLAKLAADGVIARFQVTPRQTIVYLRGLEPGKPLKLVYRLRATMPVRVTAPAGQVYEYYDPDRRGHSATVQLTVES